MLGVSREAVRLWTNEGAPRRDDGSYIVAEIVTWLREKDRRAQRDENVPKESAERARKMRTEADLKELELEERRGALLPLADFMEQLEAVIGGFASVAAGQLARFERKIVAAKSVGDARRITQEIHAALMAGAREHADRLEAEADEDAEDSAA